MPPGTRAANRAAMESEILRLGRDHLQTHGAAALSLRAIARDLGVVSSAVYRYVPSRDDLLTALVVEAYTELADAAEESLGEPSAGRPAEASTDPAARLRGIARAVRAWAVANPARWALLYGSPVPGYVAPAELTTGPGTRVVALLLAEFTAAQHADALTAGAAVADGALTADFDGIRAEFGTTLTDHALLRATLLFSTIIGATSLEVFGQYGADGLAEPELLFCAQIDAVLSPAFR